MRLYSAVYFEPLSHPVTVVLTLSGSFCVSVPVIANTSLTARNISSVFFAHIKQMQGGALHRSLSKKYIS